MRKISVDRRPYVEYEHSDSTPAPPRDWGRTWQYNPWVTSAPDVGLFLGGAIVRYDYGFRKQPYATRLALRLGYATGAETFRAELSGEFRRVNSDVRTNLLLRASGIEVVRFHGIGNETELRGSDQFYRIPQQHYVVAPSITAPVGRRGLLTVGPALKYVTTDLEPGRFVALARPYGVPEFGQAGGQATLQFDIRDRPRAPTRGALFTAGASVYPGVWDAVSAFGEVHGEVANYLTATVPLQPTLAMRIGGKQVWGDYPFHEAAFIGGATTVRGLREQRYAGDAALYGNAELRLHLSKFFLVLPADLGVFALADVGRVFVEGESSDKWHTGVGGGIWVAFLDPGNAITAALVRGEDRTGLYFGTGFIF